MTDQEFMDIFHQLYLKKRRETVASLLRGNDTQCFTTQQYVNAWIGHVDKGQPSIMSLALANKHLRTYPKVLEIRSGVWTMGDHNFESTVEPVEETNETT